MAGGAATAAAAASATAASAVAAPSPPLPLPTAAVARPPPPDFAAVLAGLDPPIGALPASERSAFVVVHSFVSVALGAWLGSLGDAPVSEAELRGLFDEALRLYNARVAPSS